MLKVNNGTPEQCEKSVQIFFTYLVISGQGSIAIRLWETCQSISVYYFLFRTPLLTACFSDSADCIQALLQNGAEKDIVDKDGLNALSLAAKLGHQTVLGEFSYIKKFLCVHYNRKKL